MGIHKGMQSSYNELHTNSTEGLYLQSQFWIFLASVMRDRYLSLNQMTIAKKKFEVFIMSAINSVHVHTHGSDHLYPE